MYMYAQSEIFRKCMLSMYAQSEICHKCILSVYTQPEICNKLFYQCTPNLKFVINVFCQCTPNLKLLAPNNTLCPGGFRGRDLTQLTSAVYVGTRPWKPCGGRLLHHNHLILSLKKMKSVECRYTAILTLCN